MHTKQILFVITFLFISGFSLAQTSTFQKGDKVLNLGIGFGNGLYSGGGYTSKMPALSASFEVGVVDNVLDKGTIGLGGDLGYTSAKWEYIGFSSTYGRKYTNIIIGVRGTFHYPLVDRLDTYGGLLLGYDVVTVKDISYWAGVPVTSAMASGLYISGFLGEQYYFNDKVAAPIWIPFGSISTHTKIICNYEFTEEQGNTEKQDA